jgi:hypothetical protein
MSLSYHPLRLVDVSIHAIVMHRGLALSIQLVLLRHDFELIGCPIAVEPVIGLLVVNQPIDPPEGATPWLDRSCGLGVGIS